MRLRDRLDPEETGSGFHQHDELHPRRQPAFGLQFRDDFLQAWTCSGLSTLVSISAVTPGITAASMSRTSIRQGRFTRTSTSAPLRDT